MIYIPTGVSRLLNFKKKLFMFVYVLECVFTHARMHMWRSEPVLTFYGIGPELELRLSAVVLSSFTH